MMTPAEFPQCNTSFGPPSDMAESQVCTIPAYVGRVKGGPIYLTFLGGLPPHVPTTSFEENTNIR